MGNKPRSRAAPGAARRDAVQSKTGRSDAEAARRALGLETFQHIERIGTPRIAELRINIAIRIPKVLKFIR